MDWTQSSVVVVSICGIALFFMMVRLDIDIKAHSKRIEEQGQRTDQLYQMFVDLLKERNKKD